MASCKSIPFENLDNAGPAGSINSSVRICPNGCCCSSTTARFPARKARIFSEKSSKQMWAPTNRCAGERGYPRRLKGLQANLSGYGLWAGFCATTRPETCGPFRWRRWICDARNACAAENLGVVILTNAEEDLAFESILYHILDGYLGGPTQDYTTDFKSGRYAAKRSRRDDEKSIDGARLGFQAITSAGKVPWRLQRSLVREDDHHARIKRTGADADPDSQERRDLQHWQYDTFKAHWRDHTVEDAFVTFALKPTAPSTISRW